VLSSEGVVQDLRDSEDENYRIPDGLGVDLRRRPGPDALAQG